MAWPLASLAARALESYRRWVSLTVLPPAPPVAGVSIAKSGWPGAFDRDAESRLRAAEREALEGHMALVRLMAQAQLAQGPRLVKDNGDAG